jgi:hypothetical protein
VGRSRGGGHTGAWWIYGYRRGGFPVAGWAVDATLVLVVAAVSPMPSDAIALFFAGPSSDRSCPAELGLLIVSFAIAPVGSTALWYSNGHVGAVRSPNSLISVLGLTIIAASLHLFISATQRQSAMAHELARSETLPAGRACHPRRRLRLARPERRSSGRNRCSPYSATPERVAAALGGWSASIPTIATRPGFRRRRGGRPSDDRVDGSVPRAARRRLRIRLGSLIVQRSPDGWPTG